MFCVASGFLFPKSASIYAELDSWLKWSMALLLPLAQKKTVPDHLRLDRRRGLKPWGRLAKTGIGTNSSSDVKLHLGSAHAKNTMPNDILAWLFPHTPIVMYGG